MTFDGDRWRAHTDEILRTTGIRASAGRAAVVDVLADGECLLSAQDILARLHADGVRSASIATVYRTLERLYARGLVRRIDARDGIARYEPADPSGTDDHHHVVLEDGSIEPFTDEALEQAIAGLGDRLRLDITSYELVVHARRRT